VVRQICREAANAHPCASRHLYIRVHCKFGRPQGGPKGGGQDVRRNPLATTNF